MARAVLASKEKKEKQQSRSIEGVCHNPEIDAPQESCLAVGDGGRKAQEVDGGAAWAG